MTKPEKKSYIYIHSDFLDLLDALTKKDGYFSDGNHLINWNAHDHASGVYFIQMTSPDGFKTKKVVLIR